MLFNTLDYAYFFGLVLALYWTLTTPRNALWLPWAALAATCVLAVPSVSALGLTALAGAFTLGLVRRAPRDTAPSVRLSLASLAVSGAALAFVLGRATGRDPVASALAGLGVPWGSGAAWTVAGAVGGLSLGLLVLRARRIRLLFLVGASYVFYAHWDWRFLPLLWGSSTLDWWLGLRIGREQDPVRRKRWLAVTVVANLGVLGFFKYTNFAIDTARGAAQALGFHPPEVALQIALPVGISFFTFESMSYVIDVYRRDLEPRRSYLEYLSFVAFFPHLVAGPIVRPRDLLPQLGGAPRYSPREGGEGLFLIAVGLVKKVCIGDPLAVNLVDRVFDMPTQYSALECYAAVLGYATQIYCDFSGYTDIAIGSALLLGVRMPLNFDSPYKAHDIQNFWRRWHVSLSTWLRDYLYIPLGGNRGTEARTTFNLIVTMLLGGLWHGASWTFVAWGGLHGVALAVNRWWNRRRGASAPSSVPARLLGVVITFHFVCFCWIFFRAPSFGQAWTLLRQLGTLSTFHPNLHATVLATLAVGLLAHWAPERWYVWLRERFIALPAPVQGAVLAAVAWVLARLGTAEAVPFVYFQF